jgi:sugar phosphate isomerase/epimerase
MKLAVSNIAWSAEEDLLAFDLLQRHSITGLEIAPSRIWEQPATVPVAAVAEYRRVLATFGLQVVAFQSLLFGRSDLSVFATDSPAACRDYLVEIARLAALIGARVMVFGSPGNRSVPDTMHPSIARGRAVDFFGDLGERCAAMGVILALEPNPKGYGCNFIQTVAEAAALVREVGNPGFRLHIDAGELQMNAEDLEAAVAPNLDITAHVHASEPMLAPLSRAWAGHRRLASALRQGGYEGFVSLEMKRPEGGLSGVQNAVVALHELYA